MSLETDVSNLVGTSNTLIGTVNNKLGEIQAGVDAKVAEVNTRISTFNSTDLPSMQGAVSTLISSSTTQFYNPLNLIHRPHRYTHNVMSRYTSHQQSLDRGWNGIQPIFQSFTAAEITAAQAGGITTHQGYTCPAEIVAKAESVSDSCCEDGTINLIRVETAAYWSGWIGYSSALRVHGHHSMGAWLYQEENDGSGIAGGLVYNKKFNQHRFTNFNHDAYAAFGNNTTGIQPRVVWLVVPWIVPGRMSQATIDSAIGQGMFTATVTDSYRVGTDETYYPETTTTV